MQTGGGVVVLNVGEAVGYSDVVCSFCSRHNREVRVVADDAGLIVCQVCVAKSAEIVDAEVELESPPGGWMERWAAEEPGLMEPLGTVAGAAWFVQPHVPGQNQTLRKPGSRRG